MILVDLELWTGAAWVRITPDVRGPIRWEAGLPTGPDAVGQRTARTGSLEFALDQSSAARVRAGPAGWARQGSTSGLALGAPVRLCMLRPPPLAAPWCDCVAVLHTAARGVDQPQLDLRFAGRPPAAGALIVLRGTIAYDPPGWHPLRVISVSGTAGTGYTAVVRSDDSYITAVSLQPGQGQAMDASWAPVALEALAAPRVAGGVLTFDVPGGAGDVEVGDPWILAGVGWSGGLPHAAAVVSAVAAGRVSVRPAVDGIGIETAAAPRGAPGAVMRRRLAWVRAIEPTAGTHGERLVAVTAHDCVWSLGRAGAAGAAVSGRTDQAIRAIAVAALAQQRSRLGASGGGVVVDAARDDLIMPHAGPPGSALAQIAGITRAAWGRCAVRGDAAEGETVRWESRREADTVRAVYSPAPAVAIGVRMAPRRRGVEVRTPSQVAAGSIQVIAATTTPIQCMPDEVVTLHLPYRDADGAPVAATDVQALRASDVYIRWQHRPWLTYSLAAGSWGAWIALQSRRDLGATGAISVTRVQVRGRMVTAGPAVGVIAGTASDDDGVTIDLPIRLADPERISAGLLTGDQEEYDVTHLDLIAEASPAAERQVLLRDVLDRVTATEPLTGAAGTFVVAALAGERGADGITRLRLELEPVDRMDWS